jgi:hypothetical protein
MTYRRRTRRSIVHDRQRVRGQGSGKHRLQRRQQLGIGIHRQHDRAGRQQRPARLDAGVRCRLRHHQHLERSNREPRRQSLRDPQCRLERQRGGGRPDELRLPGLDQQRQHGGQQPGARQPVDPAASGRADAQRRRCELPRRHDPCDGTRQLHGQPVGRLEHAGDGAPPARRRRPSPSPRSTISP